jgi:hypothetical protein
MLFVGDAIFDEGNDYAVQEGGVDSISVRGSEEAVQMTKDVLAWLVNGSSEIVTREVF